MMFSFISYPYCHLHLLVKEAPFSYCSWVGYYFIIELQEFFMYFEYIIGFMICNITLFCGLFHLFLEINLDRLMFTIKFRKFLVRKATTFFPLLCLSSLILVLSLCVLLHIMIYISPMLSSFFFINFSFCLQIE